MLWVVDTRVVPSIGMGSGDPVAGLGDRAYRGANALVAEQGPWILRLSWIWDPFTNGKGGEAERTAELMRQALEALP